MTETSTEAKFTRKRGVGFPFLSLGDAVTAIRKAGRHGNEHPAEAFARYMGHETTNSGSFKRNLAALRDWGLITGNNDRVVLTELAQRIAFPTDDELADFREAFDNCAIFVRVYEDMAKGEPYAVERIANAAIRYGVSPPSKDRFARSFSESAITAGLAEMDGDKIVFGQPDRAEEEPPEFDQGQEENRQDWPPGETPPSPPPPSRVVPALVQQVWPITGGKVVLEIHSDRPLPAHAYGKVAGVVEEVQGLADALTVEDEVKATDDGLAQEG